MASSSAENLATVIMDSYAYNIICNGYNINVPFVAHAVSLQIFEGFGV